MKFNDNIWITSMIIAVIILSLMTQMNANEESDASLDDYYGSALESILQNPQQNILNDKRSCIRRSGTCDHRPNDCCPKSVCRCNLWGTNCRCQRLGLFQKWGKR